MSFELKNHHIRNLRALIFIAIKPIFNRSTCTCLNSISFLVC